MDSIIIELDYPIEAHGQTMKSFAVTLPLRFGVTRHLFDDEISADERILRMISKAFKIPPSSVSDIAHSDIMKIMGGLQPFLPTGQQEVPTLLQS